MPIHNSLNPIHSVLPTRLKKSRPNWVMLMDGKSNTNGMESVGSLSNGKANCLSGLGERNWSPNSFLKSCLHCVLGPGLTHNNHKNSLLYSHFVGFLLKRNGSIASIEGVSLWHENRKNFPSSLF